MKKQDSYIISSVQKALNVLKLFDARHKSMTLTEISTRASMLKGTMLRVLATLESEGFVRYDTCSRRYRLGMAIYKMSSCAFEFLTVVDVARPSLERVTQELSLLAHVCVIDEDRIVLVDRVTPNNDISVFELNTTIGGEVEPHCTGVGKVLTAYADAETRERILSRCSFTQRSPHTISDRSVFLRELETVRKNGYAINEGENEEYLKCITYPVFEHEDRIAAAISLTGIIQQFNGRLEKRCHEALREITDEISNTLGYELERGAKGCMRKAQHQK